LQDLTPQFNDLVGASPNIASDLSGVQAALAFQQADLNSRLQDVTTLLNAASDQILALVPAGR
jgi:hypothetical protein